MKNKCVGDAGVFMKRFNLLHSHCLVTNNVVVVVVVVVFVINFNFFLRDDIVAVAVCVSGLHGGQPREGDKAGADDGEDSWSETSRIRVVQFRRPHCCHESTAQRTC